MITSIRFTGFICLILVGSAVMSVERNRRARFIQVQGGSNIVGGAPLCAKRVVDTTTGCKDRITIITVGGAEFKNKCPGSDLDQACEADTNNSNKICSTEDISCSGPRYRWWDPPGAWLVDSNTCVSMVTWKRASMIDGKCAPAPPPPSP